MPIIDSQRTDYLFGSTKTKLEVYVIKDLAYLLCEWKLPDNERTFSTLLSDAAWLCLKTVAHFPESVRYTQGSFGHAFTTTTSFK